MPRVSLLRASEKDLDTLLSFERQVANTHLYSPILDKEEFIQELKKDVVYLIYANEKPVGSIMYEQKTAEHAYLSGLVVDPKYQGQGIGREAVRLLMTELAHIPLVDLYTHPENIRAIHLYESFGFEYVSRHENVFGDGQPRVRLERRLNSTDGKH